MPGSFCRGEEEQLLQVARVHGSGEHYRAPPPDPAGEGPTLFLFSQSRLLATLWSQDELEKSGCVYLTRAFWSKVIRRRVDFAFAV